MHARAQEAKVSEVPPPKPFQALKCKLKSQGMRTAQLPPRVHLRARNMLSSTCDVA